MRTYQTEQAGRTDIGNVRSVNEDELLAEGDLFVVADGMGGLGRGEVAAKLAVDTVRTAFADQPTETGLLAAVNAANDAIYERSQADDEEKPLGTTIAAVAVVADGSEERLSVVNVGDSRVYQLRDGELTRLTHDHSHVADLVRSGALSDDEAAIHPERHVLTMALGVGPTIEPHVTSVEPLAGDRLLLCSDGLFNELSGPEITGVLTDVENPERAADQLVGMALEKGGNDNVTVVVVDFS